MNTITKFTLVSTENGAYDIFLGDDIFVGHEPYLELALKTIQKSLKKSRSIPLVNVKVESVPTMTSRGDNNHENPVKIYVFDEDGKTYFKVAEHRAARFKISGISDLCSRIDKMIEMTGRKIEVSIECKLIATASFIPYDEVKKLCDILQPYLKRDHEGDKSSRSPKKDMSTKFMELFDARSKYLDSKKSEEGKDEE